MVAVVSLSDKHAEYYVVGLYRLYKKVKIYINIEKAEVVWICGNIQT